jgi:outer membrane protein assembly factor BamB
MIRYALRYVLVAGWLVCGGATCPVVAQQADPPPGSSGDDEIEQVRRELGSIRTNPVNFARRALLMKLWAVALQQQGVDLLDRYLPVDDGIRTIDNFNPVFTNDNARPTSATERERYFALVDRGLAVLDSIQREQPNVPTAPTRPVATGTLAHTPKATQPDIPWPHYKGNAQRTGYTGADGPEQGRIGWQFPVGLAWESAPVIAKGRVYLASPGMRNRLFIIDLATGNRLVASTQEPDIKGDQLYSTPAIASTPILIGNEVVLREMGSRGNRGAAKDIVIVNAETGAAVREVVAGHIDYRMGYAPVAANEDYLVFSHGIHDIEQNPPTAQAPNRVICKDYKTGLTRWDFNIGPHFAEPLLVGDRVYVGTQSGYLYALKADGRYPAVSAERIAWSFRAGGAIARKPVVAGGRLYVGANDGRLYCFDAQTGQLLWAYQTTANPHAFRQFSTPIVQNDRLFVGAADSSLYALDAQTGRLLFRHKTTDWVRSAPAADAQNVYVAAMDGHVYSLDQATGRVNWQRRVGNHWLYADLAVSAGKLVLTDSDLYAHCLNAADGASRWEVSMLKSFRQNGYRILTDQLAGGAYYQSKPTAADNRVYIGTPSRFVYALTADTGKPLWKTELSAAVSGAPVYNNGRIYVGQQGGDEAFYCLDARTGRPLWKQNVGWVWGSANVSDGLVFVPGIDGYVYCLDGQDGRIVWRHRTDRSTCGEPLVLGNKVYFGGWDHYLYCFEKRTGHLIWKYQLSGGSDSGAPITDGTRLFLPVGGAPFRCLDAQTGRELWRPTFGATVFNVTPAVQGGQVFISTLNGRGLGGVPVGAKVYALDVATGQLRWEFKGAGGLTGPVVGTNNRLYVGSTVSPYFLCLDAKGNPDGTTRCLWKVRLENKTEESVPALYKGRAYLLSSGGQLYAID